jgi:hypothetical protein
MLPPAIISHRTSGRLRIKVASRKGDFDFFSKLQKSFRENLKFQAIQTNALTGSILIRDPEIDINAVSAHAVAKDLFALQDQSAKKMPLARTLLGPMQEMDRKIRVFTGGDVDIMGVIFFLLCSFGLFELIRGNFKSPPWYTAFWYAFGIFTKSIVDRRESTR